MKKTFFPLLVFLAILLAACSATAQAEDSVLSGDQSQTGSTFDPESSPEFEMPREMRLMLGTIALEDTDFAVGPGQAAELLPLWKAVRALGESNIVAEEEMTAIFDQIEEAMTAEQLQFINTEQQAFDNVNAIAEEYGIEIGFRGGSFGDLTEEQQATIEAARESGQFPAGGFPAGGPPGGFPEGGFEGGGPGGGGFPGGGQGGFQNLSPEERATAISESERGGLSEAGRGLNSVWLDAVIAFLEARVQ